jgi:hypothetical protein
MAVEVIVDHEAALQFGALRNAALGFVVAMSASPSLLPLLSPR